MSEETQTVNQEMDFSFFDEFVEKNEDVGFKELIGQDSTGSSGGDSFPMCYAQQPGTYKFRIYPENYNGRPRYYREFWHHKLAKKVEDDKGKERIKYFNVIIPREDNRVNELIEKAEKAGLTSPKNGAWKYKAKKFGVLMGHLYEAPKHKYTCTGTACIVMDYKGIDAFKEKLDKVEKEEGKKDFLRLVNPSTAAPGFSLNISADRKKVELGLTGGAFNPIMLELPKSLDLPPGVKYESLDNLYVKSDQLMTEEQYNDFKSFLDEQVEQYLEYKKENGDNEDQEPGYQVGQSDSDAAAKAAAEEEVGDDSEGK